MSELQSQEALDSLFIAEDNRANFKNVIAKRSDLTRFAGGRIKYSSTPGVLVSYAAGLVLGYATSGADAGFYKPYNSANTDGSQVAVGILSKFTQVDSAGNGSEIQVIKSGDVFKDLLVGLDSGAITNLNGSSYVEHGVNLLSFRV